MKAKKQLGIWLDHSVAQLIENTNDKTSSITVESKPNTLVNKEDLYYKDESHSLNKEQGILSAYYKKLSDAILEYDEVILFGPTDAKNELINIIKDNHLFDEIKIEIKPADHMTENQQQAFVKDYFNTTI